MGLNGSSKMQTILRLLTSDLKLKVLNVSTEMGMILI